MRRIQVLVLRSALVISLGFGLLVLNLSEPTTAAPAAGIISGVPANTPVLASACRMSERFPESVRQWCDLITLEAEKYGFSPDLIAAIVWLESGGDPRAYSRSGAVGLMQVMPKDGLAATFMCVNGPCFANRPSAAELEAPEFNIAYGTRLLAGLYERTLNLREALHLYGPMDVGYTYADRVLAIFETYGE